MPSAMSGRFAGILWPPGADRRQEANEVSFLPITSAARLECVAERHVLVTQLPIGIFAVHDRGLLRVKLQTTFTKALPDRLQDRLSLIFVPASEHRFPRSPRSARACHRDRAAKIPVAAPRQAAGLHRRSGDQFLVSTASVILFDTSSAVHLRSSSRNTPDGFTSRVFPQRSPPRPFGRRSLRWFGP